MFDKKTEEALTQLSEDDLFKVSKMIEKLARKRPALKENKDDDTPVTVADKKSELKIRELINKNKNQKNLASSLYLDNDEKFIKKTFPNFIGV